MSDIEIKSMGCMKCDAPDCDYESSIEVTSLNYLKTQIGALCPKCGNNLLTQEDYKDTEKTFEYIEIMNKMTPQQIYEFSEAMSKGNEEGKIVYNRIKENIKNQ